MSAVKVVPDAVMIEPPVAVPMVTDAVAADVSGVTQVTAVEALVRVTTRWFPLLNVSVYNPVGSDQAPERVAETASSARIPVKVVVYGTEVIEPVV